MDDYAKEQRDRITREKEARLAQELREVYTSNNATPEQAKAVNAKIEKLLSELKEDPYTYPE